MEHPAVVATSGDDPLPVIGLVAGDPGGVGPELLSEVLRTARQPSSGLEGVRLEVIGDPRPRNRSG